MREKAAVEWFKDRDHDKSFVNIRKRFGSLTVLASLGNTVLGSLKARLGSLRTLRLAKTVRGFLMKLPVAIVPIIYPTTADTVHLTDAEQNRSKTCTHLELTYLSTLDCDNK